MVLQFGKRSSAWTAEACSDVSSSDDDDTSYSPSKPKSKYAKRIHQERTPLEQVRLWLLTGRIPQVALQGFFLILVGVGSFYVSSRVLWTKTAARTTSSNLPFIFDNQLFLPEKPLMVGMYFRGVSSESIPEFGRVERIPVPTNHHEWMRLLEKRLKNSWYHQHRRHPKHIVIPVPAMSQMLESIEEGSEDYEEEKPNYSPNPDQCKPQYKWQTMTYATCNTVHELTMMADRMYLKPPQNKENNNDLLRYNLRSKKARRKQAEHQQILEQQFGLLGHGHWRDSWMLQIPTAAGGNPDDRELAAFKTTRYEHYWSEYLVDKQRRDSVTSDRLQFSNHAIHMYAYCGTSAIYEWAPGGDMETFILSFGKPQQFLDQFSLEERFQLAYNVTVALNDLHSTEGSHRGAALVHGDFRADQFVSVTPVDWRGVPETADEDWRGAPQNGDPHKLPEFKLGDFNLARPIYWNTKHNCPCMVETDGAGGEYRAPEEYSGKVGTTEKLDIYSLGNLLYTLLTGHWPFDDLGDPEDEESVDTSIMKKMVKQGKRPHINIDADYSHSRDPRVQVLLKAIRWCWQQDPHNRPSAQEVEDLLGEHLGHRGVRRVHRRHQ